MSKINFTINHVSEEEKKLLMNLEAQIRGFKVLKGKKNLQYFSPSQPVIEIDTRLLPKYLFFDALAALENESYIRTDILQLLLDYSNNLKKIRSNQFERVVLNIFDFAITVSCLILIATIIAILITTIITPPVYMLLGLSMASLTASLAALGLIELVMIKARKQFIAGSDNSLQEQNRALMKNLNCLIARFKSGLSVQNEAPPAYSEVSIKTSNLSKIKINANTNQFFSNPEVANSEFSTLNPILSTHLNSSSH